MGIAYYRHYFCRPKKIALLAKAPFARATQRELRESPLALRLLQSGPPSAVDHFSRAKTILVLRLKQVFPEDSFLQSAPVSVNFFEKWFDLESTDEEFTLEEVLADLTPEHFANPGNDELAATFEALLHSPPEPLHEPRKYRVSKDGQVVGWFQRPSWRSGMLLGSWQGTMNPAGKAFSPVAADAGGHVVHVELTGEIRARLRVSSQGDSVLELPAVSEGGA